MPLQKDSVCSGVGVGMVFYKLPYSFFLALNISLMTFFLLNCVCNSVNIFIYNFRHNDMYNILLIPGHITQRVSLKAIV